MASRPRRTRGKHAKKVPPTWIPKAKLAGIPLLALVAISLSGVQQASAATPGPLTTGTHEPPAAPPRAYTAEEIAEQESLLKHVKHYQNMAAHYAERGDAGRAAAGEWQAKYGTDMYREKYGYEPSQAEIDAGTPATAEGNAPGAGETTVPGEAAAPGAGEATVPGEAAAPGAAKAAGTAGAAATGAGATAANTGEAATTPTGEASGGAAGSAAGAGEAAGDAAGSAAGAAEATGAAAGAGEAEAAGAAGSAEAAGSATGTGEAAEAAGATADDPSTDPASDRGASSPDGGDAAGHSGDVPGSEQSAGEQPRAEQPQGGPAADSGAQADEPAAPVHGKDDADVTASGDSAGDTTPRPMAWPGYGNVSDAPVIEGADGDGQHSQARPMTWPGYGNVSNAPSVDEVTSGGQGDTEMGKRSDSGGTEMGKSPTPRGDGDGHGPGEVSSVPTHVTNPSNSAQVTNLGPGTEAGFIPKLETPAADEEQGRRRCRPIQGVPPR
ncbi:hypothetical protein [Streptomyces sp. NPDC007905]|uniref:hypothetical protein n=1 Tax=Streptomyces sp. NPDC007905 TaxID=3364788 RepID=UPI0036EDF25C